MTPAERPLRPTRIGFFVSSQTALGIALALAAFLVYWLSNRAFDAGRGDLFYLADAFLRGRTWIDVQLGPYDVILRDGRVFVPFPPFPAILLMPLVAAFGPEVADQWESGVNAGLAALDLALAWWLFARIGVRRIADRAWLVVLLGFSTQLWWVTTRGGVWHTGHLVATLLTLLILIELWGRRRAWVVGLLAGAAFLTRPPLAFAIPFLALFWLPDPRAVVRASDVRTVLGRLPTGSWAVLALGVVPSVVFFLWYNAARFGSPFESGYQLARLPAFLEEQRAQGLFALAHVPMNLELLLTRLPRPVPDPPFFRPDGFGMSVLLTSPALLFAIWAPWRDPRAWWLLGAAIAALIPSLLYYGGGWLQYGFRYFLDSIPFLVALCAMAGAGRGRIRWGWRILIVVGLGVNLVGVYWAYNM